MRHMNNEGIWQNYEFIALGVQFHYMGHFVPAKAHKSSIILRDVFFNHNIGLKVRFPLYLETKYN